MTVDVKIAGSALSPAERQYWVAEASVVEDATSPSLADTFGGVGSVAVDTALLDNTMLVQGADLDVTFLGAGTRHATIQSINVSNLSAVTINGETKMARLRRTIQASVVKTTLGAALGQYLGKCGLTESEYDIDSGIAARTAVLPGWEGDAWEMIRQLAAVEQFEIGDIDGVVTIRPIGSLTLSVDNAESISESLGENIQGRYVETALYDYTVINNAIIYPPAEYDEQHGGTIPAGWRPDYDIIEVTPGEPVEIDVPVLASLTSVRQPVPQTLIGPTYDGNQSVYTVVTNDGVQAIDPAVWTALGGKVEVEILPDTQTLRLRIDAGRNLIELAPFRIALTSGGGRDYSTLRIVGTGVAFAKKKLRLRTTVPDALTSEEIGSSTDSIFCRTQGQARRQLRAQASASSRAIGGMSVQIADIPNTFGRRAGAIIRRPDANYRVRSASTNSSSTALTADRFTTIGNFKEKWAGKTIAEFNEVWADYTARAFNGSPLRTVNPTAPTLPTTDGYGHGAFGSGPYGD